MIAKALQWVYKTQENGGLKGMTKKEIEKAERVLVALNNLIMNEASHLQDNEIYDDFLDVIGDLQFYELDDEELKAWKHLKWNATILNAT